MDISDISTQELKTTIITDPDTRDNIEIELRKMKIEREKQKYLANSSLVLRKYDNYYLKGKILRSKLEAKRVGVNGIDRQTKITEDKIAKLDKKVEELPDVRQSCTVQYKKEKLEQLKLSENNLSNNKT